MTDNAQKGERIAKVLARAGLASRRGAERMIADGRVEVDGEQLDTPAFLVTTANVIAVDGTVIGTPDRTRMWLYNKPVGLIVSHDDPEGRPTVFESLPRDMPRVISVGRLDLASEGLLLLTNNGALAQFLEHPSTGWTRHYRVRGYGVPSERKLAQIRMGATVDGIRYAPATIEEEQGGRTNRWYAIGIKEGKNREIRRLMTFADVQVSRLLRTSFGPFQLGSLPEGELKEIPTQNLKEQLGTNASKFDI
jgi:23S rRNA pseudouridine2605 synthase